MFFVILDEYLSRLSRLERGSLGSFPKLIHSNVFYMVLQLLLDPTA